MTALPEPTEHDVIVVGGGPAGSVTAGLLAQRGRRVLVLERERFPRYHIGESLITGMLSVMEELGLSERLEAMGFPRKYGVSLVWGRDKQLWNVRFAEAGGYEYSFHVRRAESLRRRQITWRADIEEDLAETPSSVVLTRAPGGRGSRRAGWRPGSQTLRMQRTRRRSLEARGCRGCARRQS